jgi:hypothetical protein
MKLTPSATYITLASGARKSLTWYVYARLTDNLNDSLSLTNWTDVSWRVQMSFPIKQQLEFALGQFTTNNVDTTGFGVQWWKSTFFENVSPKKYTEFKIEMMLDGAADIIPMFYGFIHNTADRIDYKNDNNTCGFTIRSVEDIGDTLTAEQITTQPVNTNIDGAETDGLILPEIGGMYIKSAAITNYLMKVGGHTISFQVDGVDNQANLDGGRWQTLSAGSNILGNGDYDYEDSEKVEVYIANEGLLSTGSGEQKFVVLTEGTVLPKLYYRNINARTLLDIIYPMLGITSITYDSSFEFRTWDGNYRSYNYEIPPDDPNMINTYGYHCLTNNGSDLFIAVGNTVYRRNLTTGGYTFLFRITSATVIEKLLYNARNNQLWAIYNSSNGAETQLRAVRYKLTTGVTSSGFALSSSLSYVVMENSIYLMDYQFAAGQYKYGLIYQQQNTDVRFCDGTFIDGTTPTPVNTLCASAPNTDNHFAFLRNGNEYWYKVYSGTYSYHRVLCSATGTWTYTGTVLATVPTYDIGCYNSSEDRIFYVEYGSDRILKSHTCTNATPTTNLDSVGTGQILFLLSGGGYVWFTTYENRAYRVNGTSTATLLHTAHGNIWVDREQLTYCTNRIYGITTIDTDPKGMLFLLHNYMPFFIPCADFDGKTVTQAFRDILSSFFLIGTTAANKTAKVYKRCDDTGACRTTGNNITATVYEIGKLVESTYEVPAVDIVEVSNGENSLNYDGDKFGVGVSGSQIIASMSSPLIDAQIFKELLYYKYQFLKNGREKVIVPIGSALFQYEPFDGISINTTSANVAIDTTAPIYGMAYYKDGTLEAEILI